MKTAKTLAAIFLCGQTALASNLLVESQNTLKPAKQLFTTILRNKNTTLSDYRKATDVVASALALETMNHMQFKNITIETQLAPIAGIQAESPVVLLPVIRSGLSLLPTFLNYFQNASVGFVGLARDEETAQAHWYYKKIPALSGHEYIVILEPMLATGGTALEVLRELQKTGADMNKIIFVSVVCAPEGVEKINEAFPGVKIITVGVDSHLNDKKFIVPGLGDFGDRYFGTE